MSKYLPDGREPTREDISRAAHFNPVINACMAAHRNGHLTYEQSLMMAVLYLADQNESLIQTSIEMYWRQPVVYLEHYGQAVTARDGRGCPGAG